MNIIGLSGRTERGRIIKLGFQNVVVGYINGWLHYRGFLIRKCMGVSQKAVITSSVTVNRVMVKWGTTVLVKLLSQYEVILQESHLFLSQQIMRPVCSLLRNNLLDLPSFFVTNMEKQGKTHVWALRYRSGSLSSELQSKSWQSWKPFSRFIYTSCRLLIGLAMFSALCVYCVL